jgi:hypothetical protein
MSKIKHYFKTHPDSPECFETTNGYLFHKKSDAEAHSQILRDRAVKHHERKDHQEEKAIAEQSPNAEKDTTAKGKKASTVTKPQ